MQKVSVKVVLLVRSVQQMSFVRHMWRVNDLASHFYRKVSYKSIYAS